VKLPTTKDENMILVNMSLYVGLAATASSNIALFNAVLQASNVTSCTSFANYALLYQEFRVVGVAAKFLPKFQNSQPGQSTTAGYVAPGNGCSPLFLCRFHDDATALTTADEAVNHEDRREASVNQEQTVDVRMKETDEAQWHTTTSGTTGVFGIKIFQTGVTVGATDTVNIGSAIQTFAVQFRSRVSVATAIMKIGKPDAPREEVKVDKFGMSIPPPPNKEIPRASDSEEEYATVLVPRKVPALGKLGKPPNIK
jgi:hypothetical protein